MMQLIDYLSIFWVVIFVVAWMVLRKKRKEVLGLGNNLNKQKIDNVQYALCPKCKKGFLIPEFVWWRYSFGIVIPPGYIYIFGKPNEYCCSKCKNCFDSIDGSYKEGYFTRLSLVHRLNNSFFLAAFINVAIGVTLLLLFLKFILHFEF